MANTTIQEIWAANSLNRSQFDNDETLKGIEYKGPVVSSQLNGVAHDLYKYVDQIQRGFTAYNPLKTYRAGDTCSFLVDYNGKTGYLTVLITAESKVSPLVRQDFTTRYEVDTDNSIVKFTIEDDGSHTIKEYIGANCVLVKDSSLLSYIEGISKRLEEKEKLIDAKIEELELKIRKTEIAIANSDIKEAKFFTELLNQNQIYKDPAKKHAGGYNALHKFEIEELMVRNVPELADTPKEHIIIRNCRFYPKKTYVDWGTNGVSYLNNANRMTLWFESSFVAKLKSLINQIESGGRVDYRTGFYLSGPYYADNNQGSAYYTPLNMIYYHYKPVATSLTSLGIEAEMTRIGRYCSPYILQGGYSIMEADGIGNFAESIYYLYAVIFIAVHKKTKEVMGTLRNGSFFEIKKDEMLYIVFASERRQPNDGFKVCGEFVIDYQIAEGSPSEAN